MKSLLILMLVAGLVAPTQAGAQVTADVWRGVAARIDLGSEVNVRLRDGKRFRATLVETREQTVLLQPRTRVPVEIQEVPYTAIAALERRTKNGMGAAKAAAIGVASGVGAFFVIIGILTAIYGD
jgi:hypothetical protein